MWKDNQTFAEDLERISAGTYLPWDDLAGKTVLVTGATGLIGYSLCAALLYQGLKTGSGIRVLALVRNAEKASRMFAQIQAECGENLEFLVGDVCTEVHYSGSVDYIIHTASQTSSAKFVECPVETITTALTGTQNMLNLAKTKHVKSFVYLSSMEVYGAPHDDAPIFETNGTNIDTMSVRSCYPESKRMCESLCASYCGEYGVPVRVVRLAQTFGPGVAKDDARVFAEFARCAEAGKDIVLKTTGASKRTYLYTADAVAAILAALLLGKDGEAYNAANPITYCSIVEMAKLVAEEIAGGKISVQIRLASAKETAHFSPEHHYKLNVDKLMGLGWKPEIDLAEMYRRMINAT